MVTFRTDRTLEWSPQYFLNDQLTTLHDYLHGEELRSKLLDQLDEWEAARKAEEEAAEASDSSEEESEDESEDESDGVTFGRE